jgi:hypothetical protein
MKAASAKIISGAENNEKCNNGVYNNQRISMKNRHRKKYHGAMCAALMRAARHARGAWRWRNGGCGMRGAYQMKNNGNGEK